VSAMAPVRRLCVWGGEEGGWGRNDEKNEEKN